MSGDSDNDEGFLEGDIVDNIFNVKGASAHLELDFEQATKYVRGLAGSARQEDLLYFYARYKQATVGPCNVEKPSFYQLTEKAKWNAWNDLGNKSRTDAQLEYIQRLTELEPEFSQSEIAEPGDRGWVSVSCPAREQEEARGEQTVWDHVQEGDIERLRALSDPDTRVRDPEGLTLLHWATDRGHEDIVTMLVDRDPDLINMQDNEGQTALHYGASCAHPAIVRLLLRAGADPEIADNDGLRPCNEETEEEIVKLFREKRE